MAATKSVTLRDVAKKAGVSIATVSRVMNGKGSVDPKIQEMVNKAVEDLGYFQNSIARSLKTNATMTVGFVTADISNPYIITVAKAVEDIVRAKHYNLLVCSTQGNPGKELEYLRLLMGRNIDSLVLNGTGYHEDFVRQISSRIPVILIHRRYSKPLPGADFVDSDNEEGTYGLTKHLIAMGHRQIYVIKGSAHASSSIDRFRGFRRAMQEAGIGVDKRYPFQFDGDFSMESGYRAVDRLCELPQRATAILALNNTMALGALACMKERNLSAPEDLSIAAYNNIDFIELMTVRPTVHSIDPRKIGLTTGQALLERLENRDIPYRELIINGHLVPGNAVSMPTQGSRRKYTSLAKDYSNEN